MFTELWTSIPLFISPLLAYLIGGIPFAYILARLVGGIDIRQAGSGNPGASNVFRTVGPATGILVLILDALKGSLAVYLAYLVAKSQGGRGEFFIIWYEILLGFLAVAGHIWTPFLEFKGGKGVATFLGVFLILFPVGMLIAMGAAFVTIAIFRIFSLGSLVGVLLLPINYFLLTETPWDPAELPILYLSILAVLIVALRHLDNIRRLIQGKEHGMAVPGQNTGE